MNPDDQRISIAEACGWKREVRKRYASQEDVSGWGRNANLPIGNPERDFTITTSSFPDYVNDLNAMHEVEKMLLDSPLFAKYNAELFKVAIGVNLSRAVQIPKYIFCAITASSYQRAEAFLKTIGKWTD